MQLLTYVEVDIKCYLTVNFIMIDAKRRSVRLSLLINTIRYKHNSIIVLLYDNDK